MLNGKVVAAPELSAVCRERIDFIRAVRRTYEAVTLAAVGAAVDSQDTPVAARPLALDTDKLRPEVEDQIKSLDSVRSPDTDTKLCCCMSNREFGHCAFLIRTKHVVYTRNGLGWAVSNPATLR